ncbi:MAG TPA: hypothetical protein VKK31_17400 [Thermoanaerobaculia bacterium]|nr:hypothetical protein [Thermoanaerobaculia bacterium]
MSLFTNTSLPLRERLSTGLFSQAAKASGWAGSCPGIPSLLSWNPVSNDDGYCAIAVFLKVRVRDED